jgi:undecaprenyl-diphosphatase
MGRRTSAIAGSVLLAVAVGLGVAARLHPAPWPVDRWWAEQMMWMRGPGFTFLAREIFNRVGRFPWSWVIVAAAGVVLWRTGRRAAVIVLLVGEIASWGTNNLVKVLVDRPRPPGALIAAPASSYPSGHAGFAAVTAVLLVTLFTRPGRRAGWVLLACAGAVGMAWSRTYLMVHWLTDVVGGLAVGAGVAFVTIAVGWDARRPSPRPDGAG